MSRYLALWIGLFRLSWRTQRVLTVATAGAIGLSVASVAAGAVALREVVDAIAARDMGPAVVWAVVAALAYAVNLVLQDMGELLKITTADRVARLEIHRDVHRDLAALPGIEHLERADFLDRVTIVRANTGLLVQSAWNALGVVAGVLQLVVAILLLGAVDPWLLLLLPLAALPVLCNRKGEHIVKRAELETAESYRLHEHLITTATSPGPAKEIRIAGSGSRLIERQAEEWRKAMEPRARAQLMRALLLLLGWSTFTAGLIGGLLFLLFRAGAGHGSVGDIVLAVAVASSLRQTVGATVSTTSSAVGAARVIDPYLWLRRYTREQGTGDRAGRACPAALREGITVDDLGYTYPDAGQPALDQVSVHIPAGSVVAIVGEFGSGKTTLVKLLCKLYAPDSGSIRVDGVELSAIDAGQWCTRLSAVFQDFGRFHTKLGHTIGLGQVSRIEDRARIEQAVREASAEDFVAALPHGLDTQLGSEFDGVDLSEGQWQRTALARASMRPDALLFVLDEPTASLDAPTEREIFERYMAHARARARRNGAITIVVSHRFSTVTGADMILVLEDGRLTESGDHSTLLGRGGRYAELYTMQEKAFSRD
ncbi:ATP-binding cassette domain-containing protein [Streptomyces sp. NPDC050560]|uniref:ATP-binding cassette domain-containing protein n=1 Tax=Streptomyces sp. NPDC050560 TaxID=3365630 RepID=UPI0037A89A6E